MAWLEGATRKEIGKHRRRLVTPRRLIFHTAVANVDSLYGFFSSASVCSHWYTQERGGIEQYVDTQFQAPAQRQGNYDCLSVESWDGYGVTWKQGDPVPPWTDEQMEAHVAIAVFANQTHGIPLELLPDSRAGRWGVGYHRLGCDPWRVEGGELWSSSYGKICPGLARIRQVPEIISEARRRTGEDMAFTELQEKRLKALEEAIWGTEGSNAGLFVSRSKGGAGLIEDVKDGLVTKTDLQEALKAIETGESKDTELRRILRGVPS